MYSGMTLRTRLRHTVAYPPGVAWNRRVICITLWNTIVNRTRYFTYFLLLGALFFSYSPIYAQQFDLFEEVAAPAELSAKAAGEVGQARYLRIADAARADLIDEAKRPENLQLRLPVVDAGDLQLELTPARVFSENFRLVLASNPEP